ncbi:MAG TPA: sigma 54-interacting transcriptional regulator [Bdellovibrionota bacterium]|nr:sigma 54-interacting transcriptional regulator [Bdellovibrionota bacterium]
MEQEKTLPKYRTGRGPEDAVPPQRAYLLAVSGPHAGTVFTLADGKMFAGRHPNAEICLNDSQVSRRHAQFITADGETKVVDLGSTNGTFVNGDRLSGEHTLVDDDEIQIGATGFKFSIQNPIDGQRLGLRSHGYFESRVSEELDRASRYKRPLSVLMVALDTNAENPEEREQILRGRYPKVVEYLRTMIRTMDLLAHYGKFELELLLPETDKKEALRLGQRMTTDRTADRQLILNVGMATFPEDGRSADVLIEKSRSALKQARQQKNEHIAQVKDDVRRVMVSNKEVIIKSEKMGQLFELAERIAKSTITVLIQGETGVGKEVVAEAIHANSERKDKPLVCVNCAALTETLLESELFGHEKGSFTGADQLKIGLFESAKGGSIFLDEIGEMPQKTQAKLLRVLQSKKIMRVGSNREIDTDVRIIAATNRKLEELVAKGQFREDLFYRLNAATIVVPPLRERRDEIPYLVQAFIEECCEENRFPVRQIAPDAMDLLVRYHWPGNIRELKNAIERAVVISEGDTIYKDALTSKLTTDSFEYVEPPRSFSGSTVTVGPTAVGDLKDVVEAYERDIIINALKRVNWNQTKAADLLNLPRRTLVSKIKKYDIKRS